jgi:hypothetical protein
VETHTRWSLYEVGSSDGLPRSSTVPRIIRYSPGLGQDYRAGVEIIQLDMELSVTTEAFFYDNGTRLTRIGNGTRADVPVDCPTSSYTWPVYVFRAQGGNGHLALGFLASGFGRW